MLAPSMPPDEVNLVRRDVKPFVLLVLLSCSCPARPGLPPVIGPDDVELDEPACAEEEAPELVLDETGDLELAGPQTSENLRQALARYADQDYADAAILLEMTLADRPDPTSPDFQLALYFLAKALYHLGYYHCAVNAIDQLLRPQPPPQLRARVVALVAVVAQRLPDESHALELLYPLAGEELGDLGQSDRLQGYVIYLRGRVSYRQAQFETARERLAAVHAESPWYERARFYLALAHVRQQQPVQALHAFRDTGLATLSTESCGSDEQLALRDLAALSIGRLLFSSAQTPDALRAALRAYGGVSEESPHRERANFERASVHFQLDEDVRAVALLDGLSAGFVRRTPEVAYLRATIHFALCQLDAAAGLAATHEQTWRPVEERLQSMVAASSDNGDLPLALLDGGFDQYGEVPPLVRELVTRELEAGALRRARACLDGLDDEAELLRSSAPAFRASALGRRIRIELEVQRALERDELARQVRFRLERLLGELRSVRGEMARLGAAAQDARSGGGTCTPW